MIFSQLQQLQKDPLFALYEEYLLDTRENKVNLGIGIFTDPQGQPFVFPSVQKAAQSLPVNNFNYDPIKGNIKFCKNICSLFSLSVTNTAIQQTVGGTHALSVFSEFMETIGKKKIILGTPTWGNYTSIFQSYNIIEIPHLAEDKSFNIHAYLQALDAADDHTVLLFQGGLTHNPTGINASKQDLESIAKKANEKNIFVCIDFAYLGFGQGFDEDILMVKTFFDSLDSVALSVSFSKSAALYKHRLGALALKTQQVDVVESHLQSIVRRTISTPPSYGAEVMNYIFENSFDDWKQELQEARIDLEHRRSELVSKLSQDFFHLHNSKGLFGLLHIPQQSLLRLKKECGIYIPLNSRINFGGIQYKDIDYIAENILKICSEAKK